MLPRKRNKKQKTWDLYPKTNHIFQQWKLQKFRNIGVPPPAPPHSTCKITDACLPTSVCFCFRSSEVFQACISKFFLPTAGGSWLAKPSAVITAEHHKVWEVEASMVAPWHLFLLWRDPRQPMSDPKPKETPRVSWVRWGGEEHCPRFVRCL